MNTAEKAKALAEAGFACFPVRDDKTPYASDGLKSASLDPWFVWETFEKFPKARIAIHCGMSGIAVLDIDYKADDDGNTLVDGFESLEQSWLEIPGSFSYPSISGKGQHILYRAPTGKNLSPSAGYRKMSGVDRRAGESYIVFNGESLPVKDELASAPEWLCDEASVKSSAKFEGDVRAWFDTLEAGDPNILVRRAITDLENLYATRGNDLTHSDIIEFQHRAIRLGAESNPGVAELLSRIEEYALERTGAHSRTPEEYDYEFQEGLASGIEKHGAAIELRKNVTPYQLSMIPSGVPDRLLVGSPGDKETFRELLAALLPVIADDLTVTSILWNSPRTRDIAREWGLIFVHRRVQEARLRPEPVRENPTLAVQEYPENVTSSPSTKNVTSSPSTKKVTPDTFLSSAELESVSKRKTFIDTYLAASASKGFMNPAYSTPAAWTALSMAFGLKAFISKGVAIGMNMWFLSLGMSGTGKSADFKFAKHVLDNMLRDGEGYYNLGAHSSPEGLHVELLTRDGKPSMIYHDEASSFFAAMKTKDWMQSLEYHFSDWYMGDVEPSNKLSLKELRGKSARTSFNIHMIATPDRLMELIDTPMFATGFLARYNWTWAEPPTESDLRYESTQSEHDAEKGAPTVTFGLAGDLLHAGYSVGHDPVSIWGTPTATARLAQAFKEFDLAAKSHEKYAAMEPAITRLGRETMWKCAALLALYDGRTIFTLDDALVAVAHAAQWYRNLVRVVEATSESEFAGDVSEIEAYVKSQGGSVSQARLMHRFRNMIRFSPRELDDRISFLTSSGRFNKVEKDRRVIYELNGVAD